MKVLLLFILFLPSNANCQLRGRVTGITDGDTFTILDSSKNQIKIRLHGIDCPERNQPYSNNSKKFLSELIYLKEVFILTSGTDRYGRTIGITMLGKLVINEKMISAGLAWHYKKYDNRSYWTNLEEEARTKRIGLWKDKSPVPPWEWRKQKKNQSE